MTDAEGSVIAYATVFLKCGRQSSQVTTGTAGRFEMEVDSNGSCEITVSAHEFKTASRPVRISEKDIELMPIVLQVQETTPGNGPEPANPAYLPKDRTGVYLEGEIAIFPIPVNENSLFPQVAVTLSKVGEIKPLAVVHPDSRGCFKFENVKPGRYVLKGSLSGYPDSQSVPFVLTKTRLTHVNLLLGTDVVSVDL